MLFSHATESQARGNSSGYCYPNSVLKTVTMLKKQSLKLPLNYVRKTLTRLDLAPVEKDLPDGKGVQIRLTKEGFDHVNVNAFKTCTVVVQPYADPIAEFVRQILTLRAERLRRKGKIPPSV